MRISSSGLRRSVSVLAILAMAWLVSLPNPAGGTVPRRPGTLPAHGNVRPSVPVGLRIAAGPFSGHLGISGDGVGMVNSWTGPLTVKIHDPNSTILVALLYSKTNNYATISQVGFNGQTVPLTFVPGDEPTCCPGFFPTYRADVTSIVAGVVGSGSGTFNFIVDESVAGVDNSQIDGEALYVVYEDGSLPMREIYLYEGGVTSVTPEAVTVPLLSPYAGGAAKMSIGDSYSTDECPAGSQITIIRAEGNLISDCAGGLEDGDALANGALMTVGGWGDDFANPTVSGEDDEKYNLAPSLPVGDMAVDLTFENPSDDDSVFALAIGITMPADLPPAMANAGLFN